MKTTVFSSSSRENVFANTFKFAANVMMAMLFITILTSCNGEQEILVPSSAKDFMVSIDSIMGLGHTECWFEGSATTAENVNISGNGNLAYTGQPVVYVKQLGLPTNVAANADGSIFTSDDGNVFMRSFSWSSTTGVNGSSSGKWMQTIILNQLNDSTELVEAQFEESWNIWTSLLPQTFSGSKNGKVLVRVPYLRVVKQEPTTPVQPKEDLITYTVSAPIDAVTKGVAYSDITVNRLRNGVAEKTWKLYCAGIRFGTYKPTVSEVVVNNYQFTTNDRPEPMEVDKPLTEQGDEKAFEIVNSSKVQYHFSVSFSAPVDADGNDKREIAGHIVVWSNSVVFTDPETGHKETINFNGEAKNVQNEVLDGAYKRTISILCNGTEVVSQQASVTLTLAE